MQIRGSTVLLTGATGGIGQAVARELHRQGAALVVSGRNANLLDELVRELDARAVRADLSRREDVERLAADAGPVDILVANAALQGGGRLERYDIPELDTVLDVNLRAPIVLARLLMGPMVEHGRGQIVFMSSQNGKVATPRASLYNATKFGLRGFAHALRADLHETGVGVSVISPGFIRDAGIFARSGAKLPPWLGTRSPQDVAAAVVDAVERNRAEVDVAPLRMKLGSAFAGVAPELFATATRMTGGDRLAERITEPPQSR